MGRFTCPIFLALSVILMALFSTGCSEKSCQFESECPSGQSCIEGTCLRTCTETSDCRSGYVCNEGRCISPEDEPGCEGDAECIDAATEADASVGADMSSPMARMDARVDDTPDAEMQPAPDLDAGANPPPPRDAGVGSSPDGGGFGTDGTVMARGFDLTGLYTVASTVLVTTGGELDEEDEVRNIVALTLLNGTRYRVESYTLDGVHEYIIPAVDFVAPEGAGRYQFEYTRRTPYRLNCDLLEVRFQRGRYSAATHGFQLVGSEERTYSLVGDGCAASEYIVRLDSIWVPLP